MAIAEQLLGEQSLTVWVILGFLGFGITWKTADMVGKSTKKIGDHLKVPSAIQGGIIAAVATSFPELAVTVLSILTLGEFGVGAGAIIGSAIFNILVIPGVAAIVVGKTTTNRGIIYRDALFYLATIMAFGLIVALGVFRSGNIESADITPVMGIVMIALYLVYVFLLSVGKTSDSTIEMHSQTNLLKQVGITVVALFGILVGVELMVTMTTEIAEAYSLPSFIVSVTLLAALTSFPDLLVGVELAEQGDGPAAISNVFGSNTFNLIGALPIGVILAGGATISFLQGIPLLFYLTVATIITMVLAATDFQIGPKEGFILVGMYLLFVGLLILDAAGVVSVIGSGFFV